VEWSTEGFKFGQAIANQIRRGLPAAGDKWHLDEVVLMIAGVKHWLWRAIDQNGMVLDILVQSRRDTRAAKRLLCELRWSLFFGSPALCVEAKGHLKRIRP